MQWQNSNILHMNVVILLVHKDIVILIQMGHIVAWDLIDSNFVFNYAMSVSPSIMHKAVIQMW